MIKNFIDKYTEENIKSNFWNFKKIIGILLSVLFFVVILINATGCTQNNTEEDVAIINTPVELPKETVKVGNDGVNAAIAPDDVTIVSNQSLINTNMVSMSVEDFGRSDPFLPGNNYSPRSKVSYDLLPPPEAITVDTAAAEVISTKVSGIMYDRFNPSAILNISGSDYLVRTGDIINNYKVLSIAKEHVTVQNGANVYKAGVGELFTGEGINYNTVSNLESKFGGNKSNASKI